MKKSSALVAALSLAACAFASHEVDAALTTGRAYTSGMFTLTLDGASAGLLRSVEGGGVVGDVVADRPNPRSPFPTKRLGGSHIEPIELVLGGGVSRPAYDWVAGALAGSAPPKSGVASYVDFNMVELSRLEFDRGSIVEVDLPELNAATKDSAYIGVTIQPSAVRRRIGSGAKSTAAPPPATSTKQAMAGTFRMTLDGLPDVGPRVSKISPITVKLAPTPSISNITIVVAEGFAKGLFEWHEAFVVRGGGEAQEKGATIELLSPTLQPLWKLSLRGLGLTKLTLVDDGGVRKVAAEMYIEEVRAEFPGM